MSLNQKPCPLNETHCQLLTELLQSCATTRCLLDQLENLGLDVSHLKARNDGHETFATRTKATYFPDRP